MQEVEGTVIETVLEEMDFWISTLMNAVLLFDFQIIKHVLRPGKYVKFVGCNN